MQDYDFTDEPVDITPEEELALNSGKDLKLNEKQERFCHEYMVDLNGGRAAMRAGYMAYGACHTAYRLLKTAAIKKRLRDLKKEHREQTHITFSFVIERLIRIADEAMQGDPVLAYDSSAKTWKDTGHRKPDRPTALKALSLLGKHIGMFDKEYAQAADKKEEYTQEDQEKEAQMADEYMHAILEHKAVKKENEYLKAAIAEAGVDIMPYEPQPYISQYGNLEQPYVYKGPVDPLNPSEYDDKPHYEYKHISPYKNHPEHQLVTPEKMAEAIRKKLERNLSGGKQDTNSRWRLIRGLIAN